MSDAPACGSSSATARDRDARWAARRPCSSRARARSSSSPPTSCSRLRAGSIGSAPSAPRSRSSSPTGASSSGDGLRGVLNRLVAAARRSSSRCRPADREYATPGAIRVLPELARVAARPGPEPARLRKACPGRGSSAPSGSMLAARAGLAGTPVYRSRAGPSAVGSGAASTSWSDRKALGPHWRPARSWRAAAGLPASSRAAILERRFRRRLALRWRDDAARACAAAANGCSTCLQAPCTDSR